MPQTKELSKPKDPIYDMLLKYKRPIESVLPQHIKPERMLRIAHTMIHRIPKLKQCTPISLINAVIEISMSGLEIGRTAHIIPFKQEAVVIFDYRGLIELAYRSGHINSFPFKPVYENDFFEVEEGTGRYITHRPASENRGKIVAAYAIANFKNGGFDFEVVYPADIEAVKKMAPGAKKADSPWNREDIEWTMWCKTAVRRLAKRIPQSPELMRAVEMEERVEAGLKQNLGHITDFIDTDFSSVEAVEEQPTNEDVKIAVEKAQASQAIPDETTAKSDAIKQYNLVKNIIGKETMERAHKELGLHGGPHTLSTEAVNRVIKKAKELTDNEN